MNINEQVSNELPWHYSYLIERERFLRRRRESAFFDADFSVSFVQRHHIVWASFSFRSIKRPVIKNIPHNEMNEKLWNMGIFLKNFKLSISEQVVWKFIC